MGPLLGLRGLKQSKVGGWCKKYMAAAAGLNGGWAGSPIRRAATRLLNEVSFQEILLT